MSYLNRFRRKKEDEASRFARLSKTGRVAEGSVLDINWDEQDRITHVFYTYNIGEHWHGDAPTEGRPYTNV